MVDASLPAHEHLRLRIRGSLFTFSETLAAIAADFEYTPKRFVNGGVESAAGTNEGSCKLFSLGRLAGLSEDEVLACFGEHYRQVLGDPDGTSHGNIRSFMKSGWKGIEFPDGLALALASKALPGVKALRERLSGVSSEGLAFSETLATIAADFTYTPKGFLNGDIESAAGTNEGSCKVFSLGLLAGLSQEEVLACFGEHYRQVLSDSGGTSHGNIRSFMKSGWSGIRFPDGLSLTVAPKALPGILAMRTRLSAGIRELLFSETLEAIAADFEYTPKRFINGGVESAAGTNEGSCKLFSLGKLAELSKEEVLACFGEHYRQVLGDPEGTSHGNIRTFMKLGWGGIEFPEGLPLTRSSKRRRVDL